jgi:hypothetical protein
MPAYQEYPSSGEIEPKPLPISFSESTTVIRDRYFTLLYPVNLHRMPHLGFNKPSVLVLIIHRAKQ